MRINIAGAVRNKAFKGFTENGHDLTPKQAEDRLRLMLYEGKKFMCMGQCPDSVPGKGCSGHVDSSKMETTTVEAAMSGKGDV